MARYTFGATLYILSNNEKTTIKNRQDQTRVEQKTRARTVVLGSRELDYPERVSHKYFFSILISAIVIRQFTVKRPYCNKLTSIKVLCVIHKLLIQLPECKWVQRKRTL